MKTIPLAMLCVSYSVLAQTNQFYVTYDTNTPFYKTNISGALIERASHAPDAGPADQDPEGHWGAALEGFRLSIRLEKGSFTNGEPILAKVLLRNVSDRVRIFLADADHPEDSFGVCAQGGRPPLKDESFLERLKGIRIRNMAHCPLPPGTQRRFAADLSKIFDFTNGTYTVFANREIQDPTHLVITNVVSGKATFTITP